MYKQTLNIDGKDISFFFLFLFFFYSIRNRSPEPINTTISTAKKKKN